MTRIVMPVPGVDYIMEGDMEQDMEEVTAEVREEVMADLAAPDGMQGQDMDREPVWAEEGMREEDMHAGKSNHLSTL